MKVRSVGELLGILNEATGQLGELSSSDLEVLNQGLMHAHSHVVTEMNARLRRGFADDPEGFRG